MNHSCDSKRLSEANTSAGLAYQKLQHLEKDTSPDSDIVHTVGSGFNLGKRLGVVFSRSFSQGVIPQNPKFVHSTSIFTAGQQNKLSSTSLNTHKILRILHIRWSTWLFLFQNLPPPQHGFRKGHFCMITRLTVVDRWTTIPDLTGKVDVTNLNFSKTFNKVNRMCLINKLK